jgi:hypothetical protein
VAKTLLLSIVVAMVGIPIAMARDPNLQRSVRNVLLLTVVFNLFYLFAVRYIYPHLL